MASEGVSQDPLEVAYKILGVLHGAGEKSEEHSDDFKAFLEIAKGKDIAVRRLVGQSIPSLMKFYANLMDAGMNTMLDLCEDEVLEVRVVAIRGLYQLCRNVPRLAARVADVLGQLLVAEAPLEVHAVRESFGYILAIDTKASLGALFTNISEGEETLRKHALEFLRDAIMPKAKDLIFPKPEVEAFLVEQITKVCEDVTADEFDLLFKILKTLPVFGKGGAKGLQGLVDIVGEQALMVPVVPEDPETLERFCSCMMMAMPLIRQGCQPTKFYSALADDILLRLGEVASPKFRMAILRLSEEAAVYADADCAAILLPAVAGLLKERLEPAKPAEAADADAKTDAAEGEAAAAAVAPRRIEWLDVEPLLFMLHLLGSKNADVAAKTFGFRKAGVECAPEEQALFGEWRRLMSALDTKAMNYERQLKVAQRDLVEKIRNVKLDKEPEAVAPPAKAEETEMAEEKPSAPAAEEAPAKDEAEETKEEKEDAKAEEVEAGKEEAPKEEAEKAMEAEESEEEKKKKQEEEAQRRRELMRARKAELDRKRSEIGAKLAAVKRQLKLTVNARRLAQGVYAKVVLYDSSVLRKGPLWCVPSWITAKSPKQQQQGKQPGGQRFQQS